ARGAAAQDPGDLLLDLPAVPVGERHGAACALADLERAQVEFGADRGGGLAAVALGGHLDLRGPAGDLDGQVVPGPGGEPGPAGLDDATPRVRPEAEIACCGSHGPTVEDRSGQGEVAEQLADPAQVAQARLGGGGRPAADPPHPGRREVRRLPPWQLPVSTEPPSCFAATSMVMPSRRSTWAIQSANAVSSLSAIPAGPSR